jgi:hypothetical protein
VKEDCRNDCVEALRFPRKLDNRPGLSHLDFRIGTYADIREALLRNLDKTPTLSQWTHRGADDPGIALLEGASILGDILTFYQERYANEAYLRTAEWRESISDLVRLLGYRLSPGLGGKASFAFEVKGDQPVNIPASFPLKAEVKGLSKPAEFETSEAAIAYPWLSKFNLYRRLTTPQITHDTTEFYIFAPDQFLTPTELKANDRLLIGEGNSLTNPTRLTNPEIVIIDSIRELHGRKLYKIKGGLKRGGSTFQLAAFKLGRTFHHFGNNGPRTITKAPASITVSATTGPGTVAGTTTTTTTGTTLAEYTHSFYRSLTYPTETIATPYTSFQGIANSIKYVEPTLSQLEFALDGDVKDLSTGTRMIITLPLYKDGVSGPLDITLVRTINSIRSASQTYGLVTGTATVVTFDQQLNITEGDHYWITEIRPMLFDEVLSPPLELRGGQEETTLPVDNELYFYGTEAQAQSLNHRRLVFVKPASGPSERKVTEVQSLAPANAKRPLLRRITLDRDVGLFDFPNEQPIVTVYGNIVEASQGKTEKLTALGNGDSRLVFQTFKLPKSPLTYLHSDSVTPPEVPELQIYVNNRLWKGVASFFGRKPDEQIYIVREDPDNISWVQFGDGKTGARVPSGIKNVTAVYRSGTGAFGALKEKTKVQASAKLDRLDKIQMPAGAFGGTQPEDGENARAAAPGKIQSLDRLVSLQDFESEALGMAGITKAAASWELVNGIPQVSLTVLMGTGRSETVDLLRGTFATANSGRGPNRFPITPVLGQLVYVAVQATFGYDATYLEAEIKKEIQKALGVSSGDLNVVDDQSGLFSLGRRNFGQKEYVTTVAGSIQQVEGVIWVEVTCFRTLNAPTYPPVQVDPALLSLPTVVSVTPTVACPQDVVLSLYKSHLQLTGVKETLREVST